MNNILNDMDINIELKKSDLENIPLDSNFIVVVNHPTGLLDGLLIIKILSERIDNFKIVANSLLNQIIHLEKYLAFVDPYKKSSNYSGNYASVRNILNEMNKNSIVLFPSGYVSFFQFKVMKIQDNEWDDTAMKIILKSKLPVLPIYIKANNSLLYYITRMIAPRLSRALFVREFINKKRQKIPVRIGEIVKNDFNTTQTMKRELRDMVYNLK